MKSQLTTALRVARLKNTMSLLFLLSFLIGTVAGQTSEGVITYETTTNMHRTLPKGREEMKNMIPEFRVTHQQLFFNANESLYRSVEEDEENEPDSGPVRMRMQQPFEEIYTDYAGARRVTVQEFMGKEYLIEDSIKLPPWKFGTEVKQILGYSCRQARFYNEQRKQDVVAWYAPQLRQFLGPEIFNTLPGAILEVNINDGERVIAAKKAEVRPLKKNELKIPTRGIRTTQAEFRKMIEEHMARMRANGADVIIRD